MNIVHGTLLLSLALMPMVTTITETNFLRDGFGQHYQCSRDQLVCNLDGEVKYEFDCRPPPSLNSTGLAFCTALHCEPESFQHDYLVTNHDQTPHSNSWKRVKIGESATLRDVCLLQSGLPVTRKCQVHNMRAQWEPITQWRPVVCMRRFKQRSISVELNSLHDDILEGRRNTSNRETRRQATAQMRKIIRNQKRILLPADVQIVGQMIGELGNRQKDAALSTDLVSICKEIMSSDAQMLRTSAQLNATNLLLAHFENYMDGLAEEFLFRGRCGELPIQPAVADTQAADNDVELINDGLIGVQSVLSRNLSVFYVRPFCENITGIAVYSAGGQQRKEASSGFWYRFLHANENLEKLKRESDLETAAFLPWELWQQLDYSGAYSLVFKIYGNDGLFVEASQQRSRRPRSKVLSISIPGYEGPLPQSLPFLLRNENQQQPDALASRLGSGCGYWNYETWLSDGVTTDKDTDTLKDPVIVCHTKHLTQFSFLLGGSYRSNDLGVEVLVTPINERILDIISVVGCCLSLLGLLGIYMTALLFKSWRTQASTKVLLHLCLAITLQMVLFVFVNTDDVAEQLVYDGDHASCVVLGAALQYATLALFSWMLIIAFLQFQRYVTVIGIERPKHYILKAAIVAWSLPLLPTLLVALIDPQSYLPTEAQLETDTGICYPSGYGLTFGIVLPVALIVVVNLVIFVYVFYSIAHSLSQGIQRAERKMVVKQIRLSILLFFLLGLSWIFGIFAFMQAGVVFSYLFCLTATLQGFVLFVYFVLLDEANRAAWGGIICPTKMKMDVQKRTTELQSMTTSTSHYSERSGR